MADKFLHIYARVRADMNASIYYRLFLPISTMFKLKLPVAPHLDSETIGIPPIQRYTTMAGADFVYLYQSIGRELNAFVNNMRGLPSATDETGERKWPPSFVVDTDDDIFNVDPMNPSFEFLGYKDHEGNEMKAGQKIWIRDLKDNRPILLWADGENIDYAKNKEGLDNWREMLTKSELITCSTPSVEKYVKREVPSARTFINPNCIDFFEYPKVELAEHPNEVRILWQGSTTHWHDLWDIKEPLHRVLTKHPHVKIIFWTGFTNEWITSYVPKGQFEFIEWIPYMQYKYRLSMLGHDINLCPLKDSVFNRSRSGIKWYESSAVWNPAATLAEATEPYLEIEDGQNGMLYHSQDEFETKLTALVEDATLRKTLASNAKDWIRTNRDPSTHAMRLYEELVKVREERKTWPDPAPPKKLSAKALRKAGAKRNGKWRSTRNAPSRSRTLAKT